MNYMDDVTEFHRAFLHPVGSVKMNDIPFGRFRLKLLQEELDEIEDAMEAVCFPDEPGDEVDAKAEILDGLVDLVYFALGTAVAYGVDFDEAWRRVHAANMAKLGPDGRPIYRSDGKVTKPEGWRPPDLRDLVS